mmetsp:Transcript_56077/g.141964  ORF Transcript_56077/g.141964 Transcript_56077/m.141964 type:complete len:329 (+) Transcript_56077:53-1039(+)
MGLSWSKAESLCENEVAAFLAEINLHRYTEALLRNGWDDMETLLAIEDADMKDAGCSPRDVAVLRAALQAERSRRRAADDSKVVVSFLQTVGMEQYAEVLLGHGYDEMETLLLIEDADMKELGLPRGHSLKLRKKLHEYAEGQHQVSKDQLVLQPEVAAPASNAKVGGLPNLATPVALQSWQQVKLVGLDSVGEMLRVNTLALDSEAVKLFRVPGIVSTGEGMLQRMALRHLCSKVVRFVGSVVAGRYDYLRLVETLSKLGKTRAVGGAREEHFEALKQGLDITLREVLGDTYTKEVQHAWMTAYSFNAAIVIEGMRSAQGSMTARTA